MADVNVSDTGESWNFRGTVFRVSLVGIRTKFREFPHASRAGPIFPLCAKCGQAASGLCSVHICPAGEGGLHVQFCSSAVTTHCWL